MVGEPPARDALIGLLIGTVAGAAWALWGSGGLPAGTAGVVRVVALVLAVLIVARTLVQFREVGPGPAGGGSMFATRSYRLIVLAEVVAIVAGVVLLRVSGQGGYVITWIALVVGAHFIGFGRFLHRRFYVVGGVQVALAVIGIVIGLSGGPLSAVTAVTGVGSGVLYLGGSVLASLRGGPRPARR